LSFLDRTVAEGFMRREHREVPLVSEDPAELFHRSGSYAAPQIEKQITLRKVE
jgi:hypothetical protein